MQLLVLLVMSILPVNVAVIITLVLSMLLLSLLTVVYAADARLATPLMTGLAPQLHEILKATMQPGKLPVPLLRIKVNSTHIAYTCSGMTNVQQIS